MPRATNIANAGVCSSVVQNGCTQGRRRVARSAGRQLDSNQVLTLTPGVERISLYQPLQMRYRMPRRLADRVRLASGRANPLSNHRIVSWLEMTVTVSRKDTLALGRPRQRRVVGAHAVGRDGLDDVVADQRRVQVLHAANKTNRKTISTNRAHIDQCSCVQ